MENAGTEFIDIHNSIGAFEKSLVRLRKDRELVPRNRQLILDFVEDARNGKTIKNRAKKKISPS